MPATRVIELRGKTVIPGLNDSHLHVIRGGLHYNLELRWDGVRSLGDALERLRIQAQNTPPPQWVRVVGGWNEFQFAEGRMPTLDEINAAAPDTPVFILHLYDRALLNRAALRVLGYDEHPPDVRSRRDRAGREGARDGDARSPSRAPRSSTARWAARRCFAPEDQANSSRHFMRELNRLGVTSAIDAGGGGQNYPGDYAVIQGLARAQQMTVRVGYDLFAQKAGAELADYQRWIGMTRPGDGDDFLRMLGAGENLTWAAADFENFLEPRPELGASMEAQLEPIVRLLAEKRWPFRIHATYDESISRFLTVFERVNRDVPLRGLHWFIDHAETISDRNLERVRALEGGIAIQHRMAFQGEYFIARYGKDAAKRTPPIRRMLEMGLPVGAGTDATRVASYNPWVCLGWLVSGRTLGGTAALSRGEPARARRGAAAVDARQRLVLVGAGEEGRARAGSARRPRGAVEGLLLGARSRDPDDRIGADDRRRRGRPRRAGVRGARAAASAGEPVVVAGRALRRCGNAAPARSAPHAAAGHFHASERARLRLLRRLRPIEFQGGPP